MISKTEERLVGATGDSFWARHREKSSNPYCVVTVAGDKINVQPLLKQPNICSTDRKTLLPCLLLKIEKQKGKQQGGYSRAPFINNWGVTSNADISSKNYTIKHRGT